MKKENNLPIETPKRIYGERKNFWDKILSQEFGKRYVEYRKKWLVVSERRLITDFPLYIQIEHTGKCNLRCPGCIQGNAPLRQNYSQGFTPLDLKLYQRVLNEAKQYHCPSISFHNNDEPLLLNDLETRVRMAKQAGFIDLIMTTNATLLTKERTEKLLGSGLTKINFSVDVYNKEDYKKIRIGGNFKKVLENIEYFMAERKKMGLKLPITRATCVLNRFTKPDMEKFKKFWSKRVDIVEFQNFQAIKGYTENLKPKGSKVDKNFICNAPWQQIVIRANGDVLPCCSFYADKLVVGNIKNSSIYEIWHNKGMKKIREELLKNNFSFSPICKMCSETFYTL